MHSETKTMFLVAGALIVLAFAFKFLIPRDFPWRFPGGWPLGSFWYRCDEVAFRIFFGAGIIAGVIALFSTTQIRSSR